MKKYEVKIDIPKNIDTQYVDNLIIILVRCGYSVYMNEGDVYFTTFENDITEIDWRE